MKGKKSEGEVRKGESKHRMVSEQRRKKDKNEEEKAKDVLLRKE